MVVKKQLCLCCSSKALAWSQPFQGRHWQLKQRWQSVRSMLLCHRRRKPTGTASPLLCVLPSGAGFPSCHTSPSSPKPRHSCAAPDYPNFYRHKWWCPDLRDLLTDDTSETNQFKLELIEIERHRWLPQLINEDAKVVACSSGHKHHA